MTGDASLFTNLIWKEKGYVRFGDDSRGKIIGQGTIGYSPYMIENVSLVKGLKHNLLSISQLCDKGYQINFEKNKCFAYDSNGIKLFEGFRKRNVYLITPSDMNI